MGLNLLWRKLFWRRPSTTPRMIHQILLSKDVSPSILLSKFQSLKNDESHHSHTTLFSQELPVIKDTEKKMNFSDYNGTQDHYAVLGISATASSTEIKSAYRRLAKKVRRLKDALKKYYPKLEHLKESVESDFRHQVSLLVQPMLQTLDAAFAHYKAHKQ